MKRVYRAAMYARLSKEDGNHKQSESIRMQQRMLQAHCNAHDDILPIRHYSDDGYSGTNFERPQFKLMLADIRRGDIDCVIVKDLSRFGRDYIEMGRLIERVFVAHGVRFISVADCIDTSAYHNGMLMPVTNVFHTQYARDISNKVKSAIAQKQRDGAFTGPSAPYGYRRADNAYHRLEIDPATADTVQYIFSQYLRGVGKTGIASRLNQNGVLSPMEQKRASGFYRHMQQKDTRKAYWTGAAVHRIIHDPIYIGNMRAGKTTRMQRNGKKTAVPMEDWIVVPNTHPAIISDEIWERTQAMQRQRKRDAFTADKAAKNLFAGILICEACKKRLKLKNYHGARVYTCSTYLGAGPSACCAHRIDESRLARIVLQDINVAMAACKRNSSFLAGDAGGQLFFAQTQRINGMRSHIAALMLRKQEAYEAYHGGRSSRESYTKSNAALTQRIEMLQYECAQLQKRAPDTLAAYRELLHSHGFAQLTRALVSACIDSISISQDTTITISYRFASDEMR